MDKRTIIVFLLIFVMMIATACQAVPLSEADCVKAEVLCVGLVTGLEGVNDKSFNQMAWDGILKAKTENEADWVRYIETVDAKDFDVNIATLAGAGYDIIVTVGDRYADATTTAANASPNILFIGVDQDQGAASPNLAGLVFHEDQSGFMAGALAAQLTRTNTIAAVLGAEVVPSTLAVREGFTAGAQYINPSINIISMDYPGDQEAAGSEPEWGAGAAALAIENGADVIFSAGGKTSDGAFIETASHPGLYCIGSGTDEWESSPAARPCMVSSTMKLVAMGVFDLVQQAKDGRFIGGNYFGSYGMAPYHDFESLIPQAARDTMSKIAGDLKDGSISTGASLP